MAGSYPSRHAHEEPTVFQVIQLLGITEIPNWDLIPGVSDAKAYALKQFPRKKERGLLWESLTCFPASFSFILSAINLLLF